MIRAVFIGVALIVLAGCGDSDGRSLDSTLHVVPGTHGPLCFAIDGTPSSGCATPTATPVEPPGGPRSARP